MQHYVEEHHVVGHVKNMLDKDKVTAAGHWQKFGQTLDKAKENRKYDWHVISYVKRFVFMDFWATIDHGICKTRY